MTCSSASAGPWPVCYRDGTCELARSGPRLPGDARAWGPEGRQSLATRAVGRIRALSRGVELPSPFRPRLALEVRELE